MRTICFEKNIPKVLLTKALQPLWPGVVYSSLSPTRLLELPDAPLPGPQWVRVRNRLCGICATDLHLLFTEVDAQIASAALPGARHFYLGHELVGEVSEAGSEVTPLRVGDRVMLGNSWQGGTCLNQALAPPCRHCAEGNPALCENASVGCGPVRVGGGWGDSFMANVSDVYRVPEGLDDETAMLLEPLMVGVHTALRRLPQADERVLVVGSGIIGLMVVQALRVLAPDCHIMALARYPHQAEMARTLGAEEIITRDDPYVRIARITGGQLYTGLFGNRMLLGGFDVVYDCVGSPRTVQDSLRWARAGGTVVLTGVYLAPMQVDLTPVWYQEVNLVGTMVHGMETWAGMNQSTYALTCALLAEGQLTTAGLVTHRFPLARWREAVRTAADKRSGAIKVALNCR
jgi:threonine dehydrogenase-like Zn-dependent dehydrogenase